MILSCPLIGPLASKRWVNPEVFSANMDTNRTRKIQQSCDNMVKFPQNTCNWHTTACLWPKQCNIERLLTHSGWHPIATDHSHKQTQWRKQHDQRLLNLIRDPIESSFACYSHCYYVTAHRNTRMLGTNLIGGNWWTYPTLNHEILYTWENMCRLWNSRCFNPFR